MIKKIISVALFMTIFGCAYRETPPAPISDGIAQFAVGGSGAAIATASSAKTVVPEAAETNVNAPTKITKLSRMNDSDSATTVKPATQHKVTPKPVAVEDNDDKGNITSTTRDGWVMPSKGTVVDKFSQAKKGIDIQAAPGSAVYAASSGKVVYSGNGLKGYGNLIIIRHDNGYLTAYAQNKVNLVKVGQEIKDGEKIAQVGSGGILHFELRKNGKPINPIDYISGK